MNVSDSKEVEREICPKRLHRDLIRVWVHPRLKSEDMLFGIML